MATNDDDKNLPISSNSSAGFSLTPSLTSLLKPTADYLGIELRDLVKSTVEDLKARKRKKNIEAHMEAVGAQLGVPLSYSEDTVKTIRQIELFGEWIEGAQDIAPEETTLAKLWQGLLSEIIQGNAHDRLLLNTLKQLNSSEAALLLKFKNRRIFHPRGAEEQFILRKLKQHELIEFEWLYIAMLAGTYTISVGVFSTIPGISALFNGGLNILTLAITALLPVAGFIAIIPRYKASWLGNKLLSYVTDEDANKALNKLKSDK